MLRRKIFASILGTCAFASVSAHHMAAQTAQNVFGIPTFLRARYQPDLEKLNANFAVLGVPFNEGTRGGNSGSAADRAATF